MHASSPLPPPLPHAVFYVLLALARGDAHGYDISALAHNDSLRSLAMPDGKTYPLLKRMLNNDLIEYTGLQPTGKSGQERMHYRITPKGKHRLKEELQRLEYALKIGQSAHLINNEVPLEIQKWLDSVR